MAEEIRLTPKQKLVLQLMLKGIDFYFNPITSFHPYTYGGFGYNAKMINGKVINSLEKMNLIEKGRTDRVVYKYTITKLGKSIKL